MDNESKLAAERHAQRAKFIDARERLRDEFAKAALQGMLADHTRDMYAHEVAKYAYVLADAMLEARIK